MLAVRAHRHVSSLRLERMVEMSQPSVELLQQTMADVDSLLSQNSWDSTPRRRMAMLLGEAIELADEVLQLPAGAKGDQKLLQRLGHEMYDVLWNLCDLARLTGIDLVQAATEKRLINEHRTWSTSSQ